MAKTKTCCVTFYAEIKSDFVPNQVFLCGNLPKLGAWSPEKAVPMKKNKNGIFRVMRRFVPDTEIEYKIIYQHDWKGVDKGIWKEEIANHKITAKSATKSYVAVYNWADTQK